MVDPRTANRRHTRYCCMLTVCVRPPGAQSPEARRDSGADVPRERLGRAAAGPAPGARRAPARRGRRMPYGIAAWPVARGAGGSAGAVGPHFKSKPQTAGGAAPLRRARDPLQSCCAANGGPSSRARRARSETSRARRSYGRAGSARTRLFAALAGQTPTGDTGRATPTYRHTSHGELTPPLRIRQTKSTKAWASRQPHALARRARHAAHAATTNVAVPPYLPCTPDTRDVRQYRWQLNRVVMTRPRAVPMSSASGTSRCGESQRKVA